MGWRPAAETETAAAVLGSRIGRRSTRDRYILGGAMTWSKWRWAAAVVAHPEIRRNQKPGMREHIIPRGLSGPPGSHPHRSVQLGLPMGRGHPIPFPLGAAGKQKEKRRHSLVLVLPPLAVVSYEFFAILYHFSKFVNITKLL